MDCKQCVEDLTAFLDGELDKAGSKRVQSHLDGCKSCSEEIRGLRETAEFVDSHNRVLEPGIGSWNLVRARILVEGAPSPSGFWFTNHWRLSVSTLAVAAAFALGYMQYQAHQSKDLSRYMFQYVQQREAQIRAHQLPASDGFTTPVENPYGDNPFVEIKASVTDINPFRSEDR